MRMIDADALKEQIESHVVSMSVCLSVDEHYGKVTMREECLQDIADAPTIDAVPVEWLKQQFYDNPNLQWAEKCRDVFTGWQRWQRMQKEQGAR